MLNINRQTDYEVRVVLALTKSGEDVRLSSKQIQDEDDCPVRSNCPVRSKWGRVQVAMLREMASITFEDLVEESLGIPWSCQVLLNSVTHRPAGW